jgi:hypothetical protein
MGQDMSATPTTTTPALSPGPDVSIMSEYDQYRLSLVSKGDEEEGWPAELRRYLKDMPANVTKDTDIVKWWQVHSFAISTQSA